MLRQLGERLADLVERQPDALREHDERDAAQRRTGKPPVARARPLRADEAARS
jgi:hypothetical protein